MIEIDKKQKKTNKRKKKKKTVGFFVLLLLSFTTLAFRLFPDFQMQMSQQKHVDKPKTSST